MPSTSQASSYEIRPESIKTFIEDRTIRLPRFQRKQTWDEAKDFALAISVFKGFPLGVVVINKETRNRKPVKWLLDGRQRRNALINMLEDPEAIYAWARKFVGFKQGAEPADIEQAYWNKIEEYLGAEDSEGQAEAEEDLSQQIQESPEVEGADDAATECHSGPLTEQIGNRYHDLDVLMDIILLSHKKTKKKSGFTRPFDFSEYSDRLPYVDTVDGQKYLNARKLKTWMLAYRNHCSSQGLQYLDKEIFYDYVKNQWNLDDARQKLKQKIERSWTEIAKRFECVETIENKLQETKIGLIELSGANASDAQTTFKIINSSGSPLTAVEILSAKPLWNLAIDNPSAELSEATKKLYRAIAVEQQGVVKWDAPATLVHRLDKLSFVISSFNPAEGKELAKAITLGFKLVSAVYEHGISKNHIDALSANESINWKLDVDQLAKDLNDIGKLLASDPFFAYFASWKTNLMDLTSDAVAIDFLICTYLDWQRKEKPIGASAVTQVFLKNAKTLFDSLVYEYVTRQWRGSGDSRIADHIRDFSARPDLYELLPKAKWLALLDEITNSHSINSIRLKTDSVDPLLKPILYYHYVLRKQKAPDDLGLGIEVDHIIPQYMLEASHLEDKKFKTHNHFNLSLLPKKPNISKGEKSLRQLEDTWLKEQVSAYTTIPLSDFERFSTVQSMDDLKLLRKEVFTKAFTQTRDALFIG